MGKGSRSRRERRQEEHARLVVERSGDPTYSQRTRTATGDIYTMPPALSAEVRAQMDRFREKFGREPGPDDPLIFDPDADEPVPLNMTQSEIAASYRAAMTKAGLDTAHADAYEELGYMVTEMNVHHFSAHEVEAYEDAVERAQARKDG